MLNYFDSRRDGLVDGIYFSAELLAFLRDVMEREPSDHPVNLSAEGTAGLWGLLSMLQHCIHDISRQLHEGNAWRTTAALNVYLREHPEADGSLRELLERARCEGFTAWGDLPLK